MRVNTPNKPGRPFGVTLAILAGIMLYTVFPLVQIGAILLVENHFRRIDQTPFPGQIGVGVSGGDFRGGITDAQLLLQASIAIGFLILAFLAWRGKPPVIRQVFMLAILALAILAVVTSVLPDAEGSEILSGGSADALSDTLSLIGLIARSLIVPIYVIWYMNRGPARAFYRGYYLDDGERGAYADASGSDVEATAT